MLSGTAYLWVSFCKADEICASGNLVTNELTSGPCFRPSIRMNSKRTVRSIPLGHIYCEVGCGRGDLYTPGLMFSVVVEGRGAPTCKLILTLKSPAPTLSAHSMQEVVDEEFPQTIVNGSNNVDNWVSK